MNTVFQSYHLMVAMFGLIGLTTLLAFIFTFRKGRIASMRWLQNLAIVSPLFPFLAIEAGWFLQKSAVNHGWCTPPPAAPRA